jgi:nicotinate-nucleotide adenylyltransferase
MLGILGGTFNPIHYGHLRSALEVREVFGLEQVRLIPAANPPHREPPAVSAHNRAEMVELAIQDQPRLICDRREIERCSASGKGRSYTIDTLKSLHADFPGQALLLFVGGDAFNQLTSWRCWQQLFDYAHIVAMTRPGFNVPPLADFFNGRLANSPNDLGQSSAGKLFFQPVTALDISATAIRNLIANQKNPSFLLPDSVIDYIRHNRLYGSI